ncbi:hypothetical protein BJY04DRAFT_106772 [Aspergillus karnatakaensis]|uniref:bZIP transcription factor n=1 Tax=Aspergillus karnatakaensis TaxID=1810916 RepID=UPI003CCC9317
MPSSATGETLNARARRVLGLDLDAWLAMESTDNASTQGTRSEQIAQAQRKHRQRTQSYIQALEQEVLRLRGVECDLRKQVLQSRKGEQSLSHADINEPINQTEQSAVAPLDSVIMDWQALYDTAPEAPCCIKAAENTPLLMPWSPLQEQTSQEETSSPQTAWTDSVPASLGVDVQGSSPKVVLNAQLGVNLILKLEAPCLPHLKSTITSNPRIEGFTETPYNYGPNHVYNLSTRLYHEFTEPDRSTTAQKAQTGQITEPDLQGLLDASDRLQLANELTPVQVWALVCRLNSGFGFDPVVVGLMFEDLARYSYCNSFGAAISKATVKAAFAYYLGR